MSNASAKDLPIYAVAALCRLDSCTVLRPTLEVSQARLSVPSGSGVNPCVIRAEQAASLQVLLFTMQCICNVS